MGAFSDFFDFISDDGIFDEEDFDFETGEFVEGTGGAGFWDAIGGGLGDIFDYFTNDSQGQVLGSVLGSMILNQSGIMDPKIPQVGYQGGIPEYQAVRRQTNPYDPDRRPGSGGRRYFTDLEYTSTGKNMGENAGSNSGSTNNYVPPPEPTDEPSMDLPPNQDNYFARGGLASLRGSLKNGRRMYAPNPIGPTTPMPLPQEEEMDEFGRPIGSPTPIQPVVDEVTSPIGSTTPIQPAVDEITLPNRGRSFDPRDRFRDQFEGQFRDRFRDSGIPRILQERMQRARPRFGFEEGGIAKLAKGRYLDGDTDGMADKVPATIDGKQPAALSDGEFVIPADVVSHLGNGNSDAGAKILEQMMARVRKERTGNKEQGKEIEARKMLPA